MALGEADVADAGGSCSTGRGVVCACAEEASLERMGGGGGAEFDGEVDGRVELLEARPGLVLRDDDDDESDGSDELFVEELESALGFEARGEIRPQSDLPLEAEFCGSWQ
jgi:hypothetical protein